VNTEPTYWLSKCHGARCRVVSTDEGTSHYECMECGKPCDFYNPNTGRTPAADLDNRTNQNGITFTNGRTPDTGKPAELKCNICGQVFRYEHRCTPPPATGEPRRPLTEAEKRDFVAELGELSGKTYQLAGPIVIPPGTGDKSVTKAELDVTSKQCQFTPLWGNDEYCGHCGMPINHPNHGYFTPPATGEAISLCGVCQCMTKTINGNCGKCGCLKPDPEAPEEAETVEAPVKALPTADYNSDGVDMTHAAEGADPFNAKNPADKSEVSSLKKRAAEAVTNNNTTADPLNERISTALSKVHSTEHGFDITAAHAAILALIREELKRVIGEDEDYICTEHRGLCEHWQRVYGRNALRADQRTRIHQLNNEVNPNE
jgi:hypothetical protein